MLEFISVADVASLPPGRGRTVHVRGREYALYNSDGHFYALDDVCPHAGGSLGGGCLKNNHVICPLHQWVFDFKTGVCLSNPTKPVNSYPTRVENGQVQIALDFATVQKSPEQKLCADISSALTHTSPVMNEYVTVADANQVPADRGLQVRAGNRDFAIFKVGEDFFAIDGICPHKGGPLGQGFTDKERVYCPLHGWEFNVQTGACLDYPDKSLCSYPARVENGKVQILI